MMKIVYFCSRSPYTHPGGAEILTRLLSEAMVVAGHEVTLVTGGNPEIKVKHGVRIITLPIFRPVRFRTALSPIRSIIGWIEVKRSGAIIDADIIHAVDMDSICLVAWWSRMQAKLVVTIQEYGLMDPTKLDESQWTDDLPENHPVTKIVRRIIYSMVLKRIRYAVCVSDYVKTQLTKSASWIKSVTIGNCVPDGWFLSKQSKRKSIDILYVGRLERYKGFHHFITAVGLLKKIFPRLRVTVVGDGTLRHLVGGMTHIADAPFESMSGYYHRAKVVVVPSVWPEPCGRTIIEAMAAGVPVVATRVGGTPESMRHSKHGLLVTPGSPERLVRACRYVLTSPNLRVRMGREALYYARERYSMHRIISGYESFYRLIITDPSI